APQAHSVFRAPDAWLKWALYETDPLASFAQGAAALLGDAAHASLPFLAQGAAMAIEDAAVAAQCLARMPDDPAAAWESYSAIRRGRTRKVQRLAAGNGKRYHRAGAAAMLRNTAMRLLGGERLLRNYDWLYDWRPPAGLSLTGSRAKHTMTATLFPTTVAGSLPKPPWLAAPQKLWAPWRLEGEELTAAKDDATLLALKVQEDAGIDIVTDGEQARQHFVHGFLEAVDGIDFDKRVEMGIRNDRYKAMCPTVVGPLRLRARVHAREARLARAHTRKKLKFTLPGPMTIVDTIADAHYGDRVKMAMAFAALLNEEARGLAADG